MHNGPTRQGGSACPVPDVVMRSQELIAQSSARGTGVPRVGSTADLPWLLTTDDVATLLRTSRKSVYAMVERGLLPGITRIGRRVLIRRDDLLDWLRQKSTPSLESR
jgi:excisionase family DNA binding protein